MKRKEIEDLVDSQIFGLVPNQIEDALRIRWRCNYGVDNTVSYEDLFNALLNYLDVKIEVTDIPSTKKITLEKKKGNASKRK